MGRYAHPALAEREEIMLMRHEGRSRPTSQERRAGTGRPSAGRCAGTRSGSARDRCYRASTAQRSYEARRLSCVRPRILDDAGLAGLVTRLIVRERWSPEQIAGRIGVDVRTCRCPCRPSTGPSTTAGSTRPSWSAPNGASGAPTPQGQAAAPEGRAESRMATLGRGEEFADFARVEEATGAVFYFALPHHPWQRGTNENTNGLVREYFPKGTDFDAAGDERFVRCMMRSATGRASAMASGRPTRSTIRRRCTCSEKSSPIKPKKSLED